MPWQRYVADVALELLPDGLPAYREVIVTVGRQNGKTSLVLPLELHRCLFWQRQPQMVYYSAQTGIAGSDKLLNTHVPVIQGSGLWALVDRVYRSAGRERVTFHDKSAIAVVGEKQDAGHGVVADLGVVDEAFADADNRREQAVRPAMLTKEDAQFWVLSTVGDETSAYFKSKYDTGRAAVDAGVNSGIAYFEWSAEPDADIGDPATWRAAIPALGYTVTEDVIRAEYESAMRSGQENLFRRAYLNQWTIAEKRVIPSVLWNHVSRPDIAPDGGLTFAVDVSADRAHASIVVMDNQRRAELVEYRDGTVGLVERIHDLCTRHWAPCAIDAQGPAGSIVPDLEFRGVNLVKYDSAMMAAATARFYDAIADAQFRVRTHPALELAVAGARKRVVLDRFLWARRDGKTDISPLVALTLAYDAGVSIDRQGGTLWAQYG